MDYHNKYLKYKMKYFKLLKNLESNQVGGAKSLWIEENFFSKKILMIY